MVSMGHRSFRMVVAVTTTAVIDNQLNPGPAWPLLRRLLACNAHSSVQEALVEVVLLSGDGTRERRAWDIARATGLRMRRVGSGIRGRSWRDARALDVSLFLSGCEDEARMALASGVPAAHVQPTVLPDGDDVSELRVAFDFDGVLADDAADAARYLADAG